MAEGEHNTSAPARAPERVESAAAKPAEHTGNAINEVLDSFKKQTTTPGDGRGTQSGPQDRSSGSTTGEGKTNGEGQTAKPDAKPEVTTATQQQKNDMLKDFQLVGAPPPGARPGDQTIPPPPGGDQRPGTAKPADQARPAGDQTTPTAAKPGEQAAPPNGDRTSQAPKSVDQSTAPGGDQTRPAAKPGEQGTAPNTTDQAPGAPKTNDANHTTLPAEQAATRPVLQGSAVVNETRPAASDHGPHAAPGGDHPPATAAAAHGEHAAAKPAEARTGDRAHTAPGDHPAAPAAPGDHHAQPTDQAAKPTETVKPVEAPKAPEQTHLSSWSNALHGAWNIASATVVGTVTETVHAVKEAGQWAYNNPGKAAAIVAVGAAAVVFAPEVAVAAGVTALGAAAIGFEGVHTAKSIYNNPEALKTIASPSGHSQAEIDAAKETFGHQVGGTGSAIATFVIGGGIGAASKTLEAANGLMKGEKAVTTAARAESLVTAGSTEARTAETATTAAKTVEAPRPVTEAPRPATEAPRPATEAPRPATEAPRPATEAPRPATEAPRPATEAPRPATEAPRPATEAPRPATEAPRPATEAPRPATEAPRPATEAPRPATEAPRPATEAPRPSGEAPASAEAPRTAPPTEQPATPHEMETKAKLEVASAVESQGRLGEGIAKVVERVAKAGDYDTMTRGVQDVGTKVHDAVSTSTPSGEDTREKKH